MSSQQQQVNELERTLSSVYENQPESPLFPNDKIFQDTSNSQDSNSPTTASKTPTNKNYDNIETTDQDTNSPDHPDTAVENDVDMEQSEDTQKELSQNKLISNVKERVRRGKDMIDSSFEKLYNLKLQELNVEQELLKNGKHPEYHSRLAQIEKARDLRMARCKDQYSRIRESITMQYDANVKLAYDTMMRQMYRQAYINGNRNINLPEWTTQLLNKRSSEGFKKVVIV
ncbi:hypothetical protein HDV01_004114 [Terramyces sp. JEL0728]|nr:hypothetical protein HDV01_004114 [Terramyces sp. JEL0728]